MKTKYINMIIKEANRNKYCDWYVKLIQKRLYELPENNYTEKHHIYPICFNKLYKKEKYNIVILTAKEHFIAHLLLTKMFNGIKKNKMIFAFRGMKRKNSNQPKRITSSLYSKLKSKIDYNIYVKLYRKEQLKYIDKSDIKKINDMLSDGWYTEMTQEYKNGRVGNMKGKKHSEESKKQIGLSHKGKPKYKNKGRKPSKESIEKQKNTYIRNKNIFPEKYQENIDRGVKKRKKLIEDGFLSFKGKNNPRYGVKLTDTEKQNISNGIKQAWKKIKSNPAIYDEYKKEAQKRCQKSWDNDDGERRKNTSLKSSISYKRYGMLPKEYYEKYISPLLYIGIMPKYMSQYNIIKMCPPTIVRNIKKFGSQQDNNQYEKLRKLVAGTNRKEISKMEILCKKIINKEIPYDSPKEKN